MNCTVCGEKIDGGTTIGDGDGAGQRFAHAVCYRLRDAIRELSPWAPPSVVDRVRMLAKRNNLNVE